MKEPKIKRYRLGVSRRFPKGHPKAGQRTEFVCKIINALNLPLETESMYYRCENECDASCRRMFLIPKIHTCRANYPLWAKRMVEVQAGRAVIELFFWSGKPYNSKQVVFATLDKDSGCGVQMLDKIDSVAAYIILDDEPNDVKGVGHIYVSVMGVFTSILGQNDGLFYSDFMAWFKHVDFSKPLEGKEQMCIIHFTKFRYNV